MKNLSKALRAGTQSMGGAVLTSNHNYMDTSWAEAAYRSAGAHSKFVVSKERKDDNELLGFLTETP